MRPGDPDRDAAVVARHDELPAGTERLVVLADLVRLRQVGIEVVLAVEDSALGDGAVEREPELDRLFDRAPVRYGQRTGEGKTDWADVRVRRIAVGVATAAEHLRLRLQLHVDLEPDHRLPGRRHRRRSGTMSNPSTPSSACPTRNSVFSANCGPISCRPTGKPSESPHGMLSPGRPAMHEGIVSRSLRYMASGFSVFAPSSNATVGLVGETSTSNCSKAASCSRLITVRTRCAFA